MKNLNFSIFLCLLFLVIGSVQAQISIGGEPYSFRFTGELKPTPAETMTPIDLPRLQAEDEADERNGIPPRFGYPLEVDLTIQNSGIWTDLPNGARLWQLRIAAPGARSINLLYDAFWLPEGSTLYIYNSDRSHMIGGFTSRNNNSPRGESLGFATGLVFGEEIILEYYEPKEVEMTAEISIARVVHGYRYVALDKNVIFGSSGPCNVNINCAAGNAWQVAKTSVALILVGGTRWCTGSLLNNTSGDFTPYLLTAHHCLSGWAIPTALDAVTNPNATTWSFYWNYESPTCANPPTEPGWISTSGAIVVANRADSDFALFNLIEDPIDAGMANQYNGWDAGNTPPTTGTGIHHPSGDIKKIAVENQALTSTAYYSNTSNSSANHWRVANWDVGVTEGGSSGSPLYDQNGRVVGQLHGGDAACNGTNDNGLPDWYGKFGTSWNGVSAPRRLSDWLQPTCNVNLALSTNVTIGAPTFYASNQITSTSKISGAVTKVVYNGATEIVLSEGFEVTNGANFKARNYDCGGTALTGTPAMDGAIPSGNVEMKGTEDEEELENKKDEKQ